jgi:capsular polysaccharide biosynthesis protein
MSADEQVHGSFDPEAEQEVDFASYVRLLAVRWWLLAAGLLAGALVGYAVSLGGSQVYSASASVYLGQPYSAGGAPLQTLQTNASTVNAIIASPSVLRTLAASCKTKLGDFQGGISAHPVVGSLSRNGQNPIMKITVQGKHSKQTACVANGLARTVVEKTATFANQKIANFEDRIATDEQYINTIKASISSAAVSTTDKLLFQLQLRNFQSDEIGANQLLLQAKQVEAPKVLTGAVAQGVTARSRRNTVVVSALIGLVLGALVALFWDRIAPRLVPRNGG